MAYVELFIYASLRTIFGMFTCISSCKRLRLFSSEVDKLVGVSFQILTIQLVFRLFVTVGFGPFVLLL